MSSRPSTNTSFAKTPKLPTHLAITGDAVLGPATSLNYVHDIETTVYDVDESPCPGTLNIWARETPAEGLYVLSNVPCATNPLRIAVPDPHMARLVPSSIDGSTSMSDMLAAMPAFFSGIGVMSMTAEDKKSGTVTGMVYINKTVGWVPFKLNIFFEDSPKWISWFLPPPRTLVTFDALLWRIAEDGTPDCLVRRITAIDNASNALLEALDMLQNKSTDRAAKLKELRAAAKRAPASSSAPATSTSDNTTTSTPTSGSDVPDLNAPKGNKVGIPSMPPSSPTPIHQTRKRVRAD
ncbi:hypothetical protein OC834_005504 [Tilletia horrida]|uniref:Uncharacterized protein n=1 Tax=Tilletia horrida TaxID=155126 RepID=A0AAN6G6K4_9BASI|nr:hypothetical protein OC842_007496 [Tilletia horrida]KAK0524511.1 hypothetical protein OC834_005504 [Tilletia horrida]KAK0551439.1 hypothetical protein OC844_006569 [Tilletia horrida]